VQFKFRCYAMTIKATVIIINYGKHNFHFILQWKDPVQKSSKFKHLLMGVSQLMSHKHTNEQPHSHLFASSGEVMRK